MAIVHPDIPFDPDKVGAAKTKRLIKVGDLVRVTKLVSALLPGDRATVIAADEPGLYTIQALHREGAPSTVTTTSIEFCGEPSPEPPVPKPLPKDFDPIW
tara:strand:+ start:2867 stop:3166 length:300 start_codon:yes stop_codon:yes gene_type:complete